MSVEVDFWQLVGLFLSFLGFVFAAGKILLGQIGRRLDSRFAALECDSQGWRKMERDLMALKANLPIQYVRREDHVRGHSLMDARIDALTLKVENMQMRRIGDGHD